ncbi:MAG: hypothetical protein C0613_10750 [Desulfobulbaceae bacterium]|nr:MAG: hypothetical protein C0613_10750 [Desulfobulbaceae bacterium]
MPITIKQSVRRLLGPTLQLVGYKTGLMRLAAGRGQIQGALILMYHSVGDAQNAKWLDPANHVPAAIFSRQMEFLARERKVVALDELVSTLQKGITPAAGTVVITFDDGYLDNLTVAAPILQRYKLPATLFLPIGYIDRAETQWVDQAYSAFKFRSNSRLVWGAGVATTFNLDDRAEHQAGYLAVCEQLLQAGARKRRELLDELFGQLHPTSLPPRLTMNWHEVKSLLRSYPCFEIGGHTLEHTDLSNVSGEEAQKELITCAQRLEEELGVQPHPFSFCYGRTSDSLRRMAATAGFEAACGGEGLDPVIKAPADLFRLPRVAGPASMRRFDLLTSSANTGIWRRLGR